MAIDVDFADIDTDVWSLSHWLESKEAGIVQRQLEEKIMEMLFSQDPSSDGFQTIISQFAWLGSRPEAKSLLEREIIALHQLDEIDQCGFWKNVGELSRKVGNFVADHAVEIVVGAAICATGIGIAYATGYALSVSIGGVVVAGTGSVLLAQEEKSPSIPSISLPDPQACSKDELAALQQGCPSTLPKVELPSSAQELLVTPNGIWANGQYFPTNTLMNQSTFANAFSLDSPQSTWKTFAYNAYLSQQQDPISYQSRGETALALGYYPQAVLDFGQAIEENPNDPIPYLERAAALFSLEEYDGALQDYQEFSLKTQEAQSLSILEFSVGFAKGVPQGVYESGKGILLFIADSIQHPIETSKQVFSTLGTLADLVRNDEWGVIAETLSPEIYQLVTQWDTLSSDRRGELAGYAIGKHGTDFLAPGAIAKIASKSAKSAQELVEVCKNLQIAEEILVLETAGGIGNTAKVAEIARNGRAMAFLGEELGFTAQEMGQLKKFGKLEQAIDSACESWLAKSPSEAYITAKNGGKHASIITEFGGKHIKEIQKSIRSYEKLIIEHKDKIANPSKYCPDWNTFHPNRQKALVEKIWPTEIQCYTEQMDILQTILIQRQ